METWDGGVRCGYFVAEANVAGLPVPGYFLDRRRAPQPAGHSFQKGERIEGDGNNDDGAGRWAEPVHAEGAGKGRVRQSGAGAWNDRRLAVEYRVQRGDVDVQVFAFQRVDRSTDRGKNPGSGLDVS